MTDIQHFYIGGQWVAPQDARGTLPIVNPATEQVIGQLTLAGPADVDRAVAAARAALPAWTATTRAQRIEVLQRLVEAYKARAEDLAQAISTEMGAPMWLARDVHVPAGLAQFASTLTALAGYEFEERKGSTLLMREAIGVAALITPWNWPMNQIVAKLAPALAAGCTVVLKPSEVAALDARVFAEVCDAAGLPPGVFNMVFGDGPVAGSALSRHPGVDMVSITGSTRAGVQVAIDAAPSVKRVTQELGGKSANIVLADADLKTAVSKSVVSCMLNSGQTCVAPTRMLVPRALYQPALDIAVATLGALPVGDPMAATSKLGPLSCRAQFERVQGMLDRGLAEGARMVAGGPGRPEGLSTGFYARPTVFGDVDNGMAIAREEIFGPVLVVIPFGDEDEAVAIANDSDYGLAGYVWSGDAGRALAVGRQLRVGSVRINGAPYDYQAPFGGFKKSGNGREFGAFGIAEFLEDKAIMA